MEYKSARHDDKLTDQQIHLLTRAVSADSPPAIVQNDFLKGGHITLEEGLMRFTTLPTVLHSLITDYLFDYSQSNIWELCRTCNVTQLLALYHAPQSKMKGAVLYSTHPSGWNHRAVPLQNYPKLYAESFIQFFVIGDRSMNVAANAFLHLMKHKGPARLFPPVISVLTHYLKVAPTTLRTMLYPVESLSIIHTMIKCITTGDLFQLFEFGRIPLFEISPTAARRLITKLIQEKRMQYLRESEMLWNILEGALFRNLLPFVGYLSQTMCQNGLMNVGRLFAPMYTITHHGRVKPEAYLAMCSPLWNMLTGSQFWELFQNCAPAMSESDVKAAWAHSADLKTPESPGECRELLSLVFKFINRGEYNSAEFISRKCGATGETFVAKAIMASNLHSSMIPGLCLLLTNPDGAKHWQQVKKMYPSISKDFMWAQSNNDNWPSPTTISTGMREMLKKDYGLVCEMPQESVCELYCDESRDIPPYNEKNAKPDPDIDPVMLF